MSEETSIQNKIRLAVGRLSNVRLFRNNVGSAKTVDGRFIQFGLCVGSSDLIGIVSKTITSDMVGETIGIFCAVEIKTKNGVISNEQKKFIDMVNRLGGIAGICRSIEDAINLVGGKNV